MEILERENVGEKINRFEMSLHFNNVKRLIVGKCTGELSENSKHHISSLRNYFSSAQKSINSILDNSEDKAYVVTPYFMEVSEIINDGIKPSSKEEAHNLRKKFGVVLDGLKLLENNPEMLYESREYLDTANYFINLSKKFNF